MKYVVDDYICNVNVSKVNKAFNLLLTADIVILNNDKFIIQICSAHGNEMKSQDLHMQTAHLRKISISTECGGLSNS